MSAPLTTEELRLHGLAWRVCVGTMQGRDFAFDEEFRADVLDLRAIVRTHGPREAMRDPCPRRRSAGAVVRV